MARMLNTSQSDFEAAFDKLLFSAREQEEDVADAVRLIIAEVRAKGDEALVIFGNKFDKAGLTEKTLRVSADEIADAKTQCSPEALNALDVAAKRIESYHKKQIPQDHSYTDEIGATLGWRWTPLDSVGVYVPGGTANYPSSVLMNAIPARAAGVARIVMTTPASGGKINPLTLAAAERAGVTEVYRAGGAQAVAALAYGTKLIAPVDKIVGPGNAYVAAAKREVFGRVGIDSIAGPSEILVIADGKNNPDWIAADLLSQAEHDTSSQSILLTDDASFADAVASAVDAILTRLPRAAIAGKSWADHGAIIVTKNLDEAVALANRVAPEHLELAVENPDTLLKSVRHAGAIFLGRHTPEAIGDYIAGPNHVLPTARTARFSSGLSSFDFIKRSTVLSMTPAAMAAIGPDALTLSEVEGLDAHGLSIATRLNIKT